MKTSVLVANMAARNIVFISHSYMGGTFCVGSHHLAREMAALGHRVLHISSPITPFHFLRRAREDHRARIARWRSRGRDKDGVFDYVPFAPIPWQCARFALRFKLNAFANFSPSLGTVLRRQRIGRVDLLLQDAPQLAGIHSQLQPRRFIYRATDFYSEMKGDPFIDVAERWLAEACDGLVGTSQPVLDRLRSFEPRKPALLLENGVELEAFGCAVPAPAEYRAIPAPRAVYVGALDYRFDFKVIARCAESLPAWQFILIGPEDSDGVESLRRLPNIHFLGPKPYLSLAAYLQHANVGLIPLNAHLANRGRSPMKLYEYAAAGLSIIATHTPELARRKFAYLTLCQTAEDFIAAFNTFLGQPVSRESIRSAAAPHSWRSKAEELIAFAEGIALDERATSDLTKTKSPHD